ncbi:Crp/Fnr family transcriptional regulator [Croceibacterium aestuarii]|uniref:Crp/Fnr family transcriptional regulator n=1 Tax=Croceibacterium aestuarii TaxID=3064139 RepID=UPI00272E9E2E|nr:Crp/Fnr family transcriptional regulator [Croceibacterium sp. D39]
MTDCAQCPVRDQAICSSLSDDDVARLGQFGRLQRLRRGTVLQWEDEESLLVGNVIEGVLKLSSTASDGREQTLGLAHQGDFVGRPFGPKSAHSVVALTDAQVCTFRRAEFDSFARTQPELEHDLLERALTDLDRTRSWLMLLGRKTAGQKIATFLLDMVERARASGAPECGPVTIELPCGRQEIADMLGTTIETVSRQITALRNRGIIETPGTRRIMILDREALVLLTEAE